MAGFGRREIDFIQALCIYNRYIECYSVVVTKNMLLTHEKKLVLSGKNPISDCSWSNPMPSTDHLKVTYHLIKVLCFCLSRLNSTTYLPFSLFSMWQQDGPEYPHCVVASTALLTLSWPRFFRYHKDSSENWYIEYSICTYATINFFEKKFSFEGVRPEKGLKIWPFYPI